MLEMITLYHVTSRDEFDSIMEHGVSPAFAETRTKCMWLVDDEHLMWSLAHISSRKDISTLRLLVFVVSVPKLQLRRTKWAGVYQCFSAAYPTNIEHADVYIREEEDLMSVRKKSSKL